MAQTAPRVGRPSGLLLNHVAAHAFLNGRPQSWWAAEAEVSTAHLSGLMSGGKGADLGTAERLGAALGVDPGALFPELVQFRTAVKIRHFVASGAAA